ncbi:uncharacterized protein BDZ99DRAFT_312968 [Mytilinidion resinicola]|uniref:Coenzyme Q-binding protein COQ10 START domain-containing protein n=1 Tax=Mytilinidion resinicola TaxID=574789 RepID=A0A6A6YNK9_9PEZI|nr:uncharacterized protein BDZ99DRAFT_312968 [Mytilinidion resinicola]KAF2810476.1 hypothetical protein BDZ99DRAFT_312968 [Mytilinidion resinicola]
MKPLRPPPSVLRARLPHPHHLRNQRRTFLPNPFTHPSSPLAAAHAKPATLTVSRILPYAHTDLFNLIADVPSYAQFLPYCQSSTVTKWSAEDAHGKRWPSEATLVVGFGGVREGFQSKVYCVAPGAGNTGVGIVEAVSGKSRTRLGAELIRHHLWDSTSKTTPEVVEGDSGLLTHLLTRWTLRPFMFKPPPGKVPGRLLGVFWAEF